MLEKITPKVESWLSRWSELMWQPRNSFRRVRRRNDISSFEFFVGNCLAGFLTSALASVLYFVTFHRATFASDIRSEGAGLIPLATALFGAYAVLSLLAILIGGATSYAVYKNLGSHGSFTQHISAHLELTFIDFIGTFAITLLILSAPKEYLRGVKYFEIALPIMLLIFFWNTTLLFDSRSLGNAIHSYAHREKSRPGVHNWVRALVFDHQYFGPWFILSSGGGVCAWSRYGQSYMRLAGFTADLFELDLP